MKVCMYPAHHDKNEVIEIITASLKDKENLQIEDFSYFTSLFRKMDVFHIHWPDAVLFPAPKWRVILKYLLLLLFFVRLKTFRIPVIWTVHNVRSHENAYPKLEKVLWASFRCVVTELIHLCPQSIEDLKNRLPKYMDVPYSVIPHPHYKDIYHTRKTKSEARKIFGLNENNYVFLFFGLIRKYKGVDNLVSAFRELEMVGTDLVIAGEIHDMTVLAIDAAEIPDNIRILNGFLPTNELVDLVTASDCVVLPYKYILNSGVAIFSLSLDRPIIGSPSGCILDYRERLGPNWVTLIDSSLAEAIATRASSSFDGLENSPDLGFANPALVADQIYSVYKNSLNLK